jgi:hypothetical protein
MNWAGIEHRILTLDWQNNVGSAPDMKHMQALARQERYEALQSVCNTYGIG